MAAIEGTELLRDVFGNTNIMGISWIAGLIIAAITLLIITREPEKWKQLFLPILVGWSLVGLRISAWLIILAAIYITFDILNPLISGERLGSLISPAKHQDRQIAGMERQMKQASVSENYQRFIQLKNEKASGLRINLKNAKLIPKSPELKNAVRKAKELSDANFGNEPITIYSSDQIKKFGSQQYEAHRKQGLNHEQAMQQTKKEMKAKFKLEDKQK